MTARADRTAVVTGGAGFVGSHVCDRLLAEGWEVVCVDNLASGTRENLTHLADEQRFHFVERDVSAPGALAGLPGRGRCELVLHLACPASPADYLRLPLETLDVGSNGTRNALELATATGARFVLTSTSEVYGDPLEHPQRESYWGNVNPIGPRSVYDEAKRFAEALVTAHRKVHGTDAGIVRIFNTYGPRMRAGDGRAVPTFVRQALDGEPLTVTGDGSQTRSLCFVDDTVEGLLAMARRRGFAGPVNIGGQDEITMLDLARHISDLVGTGAPVTFVEAPADDPARRRPDTSLARRELGWRQVTGWEEGLKRTIGWFATPDVT
jgi:dTDP-glucose 4,6-dehydratase